MADRKMSELSAQTSLSGTDIMELVRAGANYKITVANMITSILANDPEIAALAGLTSAADKLPYFTGSGTATVTTLSSFARTLIDDVDAATARTTLGITNPITQVYDSTLGADAANFDVTSIASTYTSLLLFFQGRGAASAQSVTANIRFNNDSGANYSREKLDAATTTSAAQNGSGETSGLLADIPAASATAGNAGAFHVVIHNYAGTTFRKNWQALGGGIWDANFLRAVAGTWLSTAAINRITIVPGSGNILAGSRLTIYGLA